MKNIVIVVYYVFLQFLPMKPFPFYSVGYYLRRIAARALFKHTGKEIVVKSRCYFGDGSRLSVGDFSQLSQGGRFNGTISIGEYVLMGPDVIMMATSHEYEEIDIPIMLQGEAEEREIRVGDGVWLGARSIILPGVCIGDHSIVASGSVVTRSFGPYSIIGGVPARLIKIRGDENAESKG
tara:strand:- start:7302 stop:7841 length:540 start_codon:yes stop_codon:yes gene_type:complete